MDVTEFCVNVARTHLEELGINMDCRVEFFRENVSLNGRVGLLVGEGVLGLYKPSLKTCFVRLSSVPIMISTIAHEACHHFLLWNSLLGQRLVEHDIAYELYKHGKINALGGGREFRALFEVSRFVNEGFATFAGHYVLERFASTMSSIKLSQGMLKKEEVEELLQIYRDMARNLDGRKPEYYYGRLEFERIAGIFGYRIPALAAVLAMNIDYRCDVSALAEYNSRAAEMALEGRLSDLRALRTTPHLRLLAFSRYLPKLIRDDIFPRNNGDYFLNVVKRCLGDDFVETVVTSLELPVSRIKMGYLLGEAYHQGSAAPLLRVALPEKDKLMYLAEMDTASFRKRVKSLAERDSELKAGFYLSALKRCRSMLELQEICSELALLGVEDAKKLAKLAEYYPSTSSLISEIEQLVSRYID